MREPKYNMTQRFVFTLNGTSRQFVLLSDCDPHKYGDPIVFQASDGSFNIGAVYDVAVAYIRRNAKGFAFQVEVYGDVEANDDHDFADYDYVLFNGFKTQATAREAMNAWITENLGKRRNART